jgi:TfdA family taurine catabolism dioxygenase TauD
VTAPAVGGETPIADSRRVLEAIGPEVSEEFRERGVLYVRNFRKGFGLSWQDTFQTPDRDRVEEFCRKAGIEYVWKGDDDLQTREKRPAMAQHPRSGERVWFNQAHLFHVSSLGEEVAQLLLSEFGEVGLPRNSYFGDGAPIPASSLGRIREAYGREEIVFPWQRRDILVLDNMLSAHGRRPYEGAREIVVAMTDPVTGAAS